MWDLQNHMVEKLNQKELEIGAVTLRQLWTRRNMFVFQNKFESPRKFMQKEKKIQEDYQNAQKPKLDLTSNQVGNQGREDKRWALPRENQLKVNWDAAMNVEANTTSLGMIISDSAGEMHSSSCCNMRIGYQPAIA